MTINYTVSSGNIFADVGLPNPDLVMAKSELLRKVQAIIQQEGWNYAQAAKALGVGQTRASDLVNGKLSVLTAEALLDYLRRLGHDVRITVTPHEEDREGRIEVSP